MQIGLLITCPEHDDATAYLSYFSKKIIEESEKKLIKVKRIGEKDLNMDNFSDILKQLDYRLIVLNGHGSYDSIFGHKKNVIVQVGKNEFLLKERIVYARSCNAGVKLGPECMKNSKNGCFIGYELPFIFFMDSKWTTKPNNDKIAKLFLEPSNLVPISIIKGRAAFEAHDNSKKQMLKTMNHLLTTAKEQETPFYLEALWNNYLGQVICGNDKAALET